MTKAKTLADTVSTGGPLATPGAVNLPGGAQGSVPYQSAAGVTALLAPGTSGQVLTSGGAGAAPTWASASAGGFSNLTAYTTSGTWTAPAGITKIKVTITGGGGGGGGINNGYITNSTSGGGAAGGTAIKIFTVSPGSTYSFTIGAGGAGGQPYANGGATGGSSSITVGATTVTANGGTGGSNISVVGNVLASGGTATNGNVNVTGGDGFTGISGSGSERKPAGQGGASYWGGGAYAWTTGDPNDGVNASAYGSGGSGCATQSAANRVGGAGAVGILVIEY